MILSALLFAGVLLFQVPPAQTSSAEKRQPAPSSEAESEMGEKLLKVKRIYVDSFGDDPISKTLQGMIINSLSETKRFIITENKDKADAILRGSTLEKSSQEVHAFGSGTAVARAAGAHSGSVTGTPSMVSGSHSGGFAAAGSAINDSSVDTETINDARLAVRLVSADGDVIWTTTQESKGAKFKGAGADVADKVSKQLLRDIEKQEKASKTK